VFDLCWQGLVTWRVLNGSYRFRLGLLIPAVRFRSEGQGWEGEDSHRQVNLRWWPVLLVDGDAVPVSGYGEGDEDGAWAMMGISYSWTAMTSASRGEAEERLEASGGVGASGEEVCDVSLQGERGPRTSGGAPGGGREIGEGIWGAGFTGGDEFMRWCPQTCGAPASDSSVARRRFRGGAKGDGRGQGVKRD
jgi:hypothetical protein